MPDDRTGFCQVHVKTLRGVCSSHPLHCSSLQNSRAGAASKGSGHSLADVLVCPSKTSNTKHTESYAEVLAGIVHQCVVHKHSSIEGFYAFRPSGQSTIPLLAMARNGAAAAAAAAAVAAAGDGAGGRFSDDLFFKLVDPLVPAHGGHTTTTSCSSSSLYCFSRQARQKIANRALPGFLPRHTYRQYQSRYSQANRCGISRGGCGGVW